MTELMTPPRAVRPTPEVRLRAIVDADFSTALRYFVGGMLGGVVVGGIGAGFGGWQAGFFTTAGIGIALAVVNAFFAFFSVPGSTGPGTADGWRRRIALLIAGVTLASVSGVVLQSAFIAACAAGAALLVTVFALLVVALRERRASKRS